MKSYAWNYQLPDEKTRVDPWSHIDTFEGWTVLTETIVLPWTIGKSVGSKPPVESSVESGSGVTAEKNEQGISTSYIVCLLLARTLG